MLYYHKINRNEGTTIFRLWAKIMKDNHLVKDLVVCNEEHAKRTKKVLDALDEVCVTFDLSKPIWLESTITDFKRHDKTRFSQDNFIETIEFDYLEIHVIEED